MNIQPDWIKGGDPHRTEWSGGKDLLAGFDIRWHRSGEWNEGGRIITVDSGITESGDLKAIRIQGEIERTIRGIRGELGWCQRGSDEIMIPFISPRSWSAPWLQWLYGEIAREELFDKLGLAKDGLPPGRVLLKYTEKFPDRRLGKRISSAILRALSAIVFGFLLGWSLKSSIHGTERQQPEAGKHEILPKSAKPERDNQSQ